MKSSVFVGSAAACICLCLVSLLDPVHALARDASDIPDFSPAQKLSETETAAIFHEIQVFASAEISMRAAMAIVEKHTGAKVVDISFDGRVDRSVYRIKAYHGKDIWNGAIDASTGTMIGDGIVTAVSSLDVKDKVALAGFRTAGIDLSDAAEIAQNQTTGKAVSAGLQEVGGKLLFLVVVVIDGNLNEVSIDPRPGANSLSKSIVGKQSKPYSPTRR